MTPPADPPYPPVPRSSCPGNEWPAIPTPNASLALALQYQFSQSEWWSPAVIAEHQFGQIGHLLRHAALQVPYWREHLTQLGHRPATAVEPAWFTKLPVLTRREAQALGPALFAQVMPQGHGALIEGQTSGSTGVPLKYRGSELTQAFWRAFALRDHLWHRRDFTKTLAIIRPKLQDGTAMNWGAVADTVFRTGRCVNLNINADLDTQLRWLERENPHYLLTNAHNLYWLARRALESGVRIPNLQQARPLGGTFPADTRELVRRAWNARVTDMYTCEEAGYLALQCPDTDAYHVQAENVLLEVLNEAGQPCQPGEIGQVVLTALHNFAMPLIRYALGDYAEVGPPCTCGRGLPVLRRILGRQRNILTLPDGRRHWPSFPSDRWSHTGPINQIQLVQKTREVIEVRTAVSRTMTEGERSALITALQHCLENPFSMQIVEVDQIHRSADLKFEDFISELV